MQILKNIECISEYLGEYLSILGDVFMNIGPQMSPDKYYNTVI